MVITLGRRDEQHFPDSPHPRLAGTVSAGGGTLGAAQRPEKLELQVTRRQISPSPSSRALVIAADRDPAKGG